MIDFTLANEGSIAILTPSTPQAVTWVDAHLPPDSQRWGKGTVIEHRYVVDIIENVRADGLTLEIK